MREDMARVIVERPRQGWRGRYPRGAAARGLRRDPEGAPKREAMGRGYATRELSDHVMPLVRFLRSRCGRAWDDVYAELTAHVRCDHTLQRHVLQHLWFFVHAHTWRGKDGRVWSGSQRWGGPQPLREADPWQCTFYVCPDTRTLRGLPARRQAALAPVRETVVLSDDVQLRRLSNRWYRVVLTPVPPGGAFDRVLRRRVLPHEALLVAEHGRAGVSARSKRPLRREELEAHGLSNGVG